MGGFWESWLPWEYVSFFPFPFLFLFFSLFLLGILFFFISCILLCFLSLSIFLTLYLRGHGDRFKLRHKPGISEKTARNGKTGLMGLLSEDGIPGGDGNVRFFAIERGEQEVDLDNQRGH